MKKNLKNIFGTLVFLALALCILASVSYMLRPTENGTGRWKVAGFYGEEKDSLDVVTIGSSAIYRFFHNPYFYEHFGMTSYNFAGADQEVQILGALIDEVEREQSPQLYVIETRKFIKGVFADDAAAMDEVTATEATAKKEIRLRRFTDNMPYSWNRFKLINDQVEGNWEDKLDYHLDIIRYHGNWEKVTPWQIRTYYDNTRNNTVKGWSNIVNIDPKEPLPKFDTLEPLPIEEDSEGYLRDLLQKCKDEQINVVFVSTPWNASEEQRRKNIYIGNIVEEYGFLFYNGNELVDEMGLDYTTDFYDNAHVNVWGAEKFTQHFGDFIVENFDLKPAKHSKSVVKSWKKCVKTNAKEVAEKVEKLKNGELEGAK